MQKILNPDIYNKEECLEDIARILNLVIAKEKRLAVNTSRFIYANNLRLHYNA